MKEDYYNENLLPYKITFIYNSTKLVEFFCTNRSPRNHTRMRD